MSSSSVVTRRLQAPSAAETAAKSIARNGRRNRRNRAARHLNQAQRVVVVHDGHKRDAANTIEPAVAHRAQHGTIGQGQPRSHRGGQTVAYDNPFDSKKMSGCVERDDQLDRSDIGRDDRLRRKQIAQPPCHVERG
jgi:hypothetical protein